MVPGESITATTTTGTITVQADSWLGRSYTWEGATRSVIMWPRAERWYGSLGIYFPGPGHHWKEHNGITRGVVEEGQQHFASTEQALDWLRSRWLPLVYTHDGLAVGWSTTPSREQLNVEVWQVVIDGHKPTNLPGASDQAIRTMPPPS